MNRELALFSLAVILTGCASSRPYRGTRIAILEIKSVGGATVIRNAQETPADDLTGARAALERQLLLRGIVLAGGSHAGSMPRKRYPESEPTEVALESIPDRGQLQPAMWRGGAAVPMNIGLISRVTPGRSLVKGNGPADYGLIVNIQHNIGLLTIFTLGLLPYTIDITARVVDLHTGDVRAAVSQGAFGTIFSSRGVSRGVRKVGDKVAAELLRLESPDWSTIAQRLESRAQ